MIAQTEYDLIGYPSIDKSWLKYYDKALTEEEIPECSRRIENTEKKEDKTVPNSHDRT